MASDDACSGAWNRRHGSGGWRVMTMTVGRRRQRHYGPLAPAAAAASASTAAASTATAAATDGTGCIYQGTRHVPGQPRPLARARTPALHVRCWNAAQAARAGTPAQRDGWSGSRAAGGLGGSTCLAVARRGVTWCADVHGWNVPRRAGPWRAVVCRAVNQAYYRWLYATLPSLPLLPSPPSLPSRPATALPGGGGGGGGGSSPGTAKPGGGGGGGGSGGRSVADGWGGTGERGTGGDAGRVPRRRRRRRGWAQADPPAGAR